MANLFPFASGGTHTKPALGSVITAQEKPSPVKMTASLLATLGISTDSSPLPKVPSKWMNRP